MKNEPDFYRYVLAYDDGWAPCIDGGLVTLATCKPRIRRGAEVGDWVAGFYPGSQNRGVVAWVGRVASKLAIGDYEKTYRGRRDAVYRPKFDGTVERLKPGYHPDANEIRKDLSAPVLVFDESATWFFGDTPYELPVDLLPLAARGQGHRVRLRLPDDLDRLQQWLRGIAPAGIYGKPRMQAKLDGCGGCVPKGACREVKSSRGC
ncbi:MAG: hypothetical protein P4L73_01775 [Caulobacteraceae bacterium]|nr:hypothetical protein [Caulobacteraceae bacterium]